MEYLQNLHIFVLWVPDLVKVRWSRFVPPNSLFSLLFQNDFPDQTINLTWPNFKKYEICLSKYRMYILRSIYPEKYKNLLTPLDKIGLCAYTESYTFAKKVSCLWWKYGFSSMCWGNKTKISTKKLSKIYSTFKYYSNSLYQIKLWSTLRLSHQIS